LCIDLMMRFCPLPLPDPFRIGCESIAKKICAKYVSQDCKDILGPVDPNELVGPSGYSFENWVIKYQNLPYKIYFENDPDLATAPAQVVSIKQTLDSNLDIRTFRLGSFGFGEHVFQVPENRAYYSGRLDVVDSLGVYVDVTAGLDVMTNEVFWTFQSIDPETGLPPTNPLAGFLPVNDPETGVGQGFVTYTINASEDSITGDVIDAQASIVFDVNEPIETPPIFNTIDADAPSSEVRNTVNFIDAITFEVSWSGQDVEGGSGLGSFDIFVSDNGSTYGPWLTDAVETSAYFTGEFGHAYSFYSIAHDNAGNDEPAPSSADATVMVMNYAPTNPTPFDGEPSVVSPSLVFSWDAGFEATSYDLYVWQQGEVLPSTPMASDISETNYTPAIPLLGSTTYYWQLVAKGTAGETPGPVWTFTTNGAPDIPSEPSPLDGATDVSIHAGLSWLGGDPDNDDVTYDVFFAQNYPPSGMIVQGYPATSYPLAELSYGTSYFWQIVSEDEHGEKTPGPIWSFTTFFDIDDLDNDGLTNKQEVLLETDPYKRDTDDDGISDGDEITWGTDPNNDMSIPNIACEGDFEPDNDVDGLDLKVITDTYGLTLGDQGYNANADFTGDGLVDEEDLLIFLPDFGRINCDYIPVPGDLDNDGDVDQEDSTVILDSLGSCEGDPAYNPQADYNRDNCVTDTDFVIWSGFYNP
jgi:hypothetical protein